MTFPNSGLITFRSPKRKGIWRRNHFLQPGTHIFFGRECKAVAIASKFVGPRGQSPFARMDYGRNLSDVVLKLAITRELPRAKTKTFKCIIVPLRSDGFR